MATVDSVAGLNTGVRVKGVVLLAIAATACAAPAPQDREVRLARLAAQRQSLVEQLENLQARLLVGRERVRFWQEMQVRHESISAVACTSQEAHAVAMAERLMTPDRPKVAQPRLRARVAAMRAGADRPTPRR